MEGGPTADGGFEIFVLGRDGHVVRSRDEGETWTEVLQLADERERGLNAGDILWLGEGDIMIGRILSNRSLRYRNGEIIELQPRITNGIRIIRRTENEIYGAGHDGDLFRLEGDTWAQVTPPSGLLTPAITDLHPFGGDDGVVYVKQDGLYEYRPGTVRCEPLGLGPESAMIVSGQQIHSFSEEGGITHQIIEPVR